MNHFTVVFAISCIVGVFGLPTANQSCDCVCGARGRGNRIVGGEPTAAHEYPWLVGLWRQGRIYCGGAVISSKHILTAAHCVNGFEADDIRVYLGGHNISTDYTEIRRVSDIQQHEYFDILTYNNDIAVITLDKAIKFGPKVQPACLPTELFKEYSGKLGLIAGWGRTGEKELTSNILRSVVVPIWSQNECLDSGYGKKRLTDNMFCAGYEEGLKDSCQGDSGGPLQYEGSTGSMEIIGIVSWGRGCARPNLPGIYTRVSNYLPWIQKKMGQQCLCSPKKGVRTNFMEKISLAKSNDIKIEIN